MLLFAFQTLTSGWYLILCLLAAAGLTFLLYKKAAAFPKPWNSVLPALRFLGLFFLLVLLLSPFITLTLEQEEKPTLLVYLDKSNSASRESTDLYDRQLQGILDKLDNRYNVRIYHFSNKVYRAGDTVKNPDVTDLGQVSAHVNDFKDSRSVAAIMVLSDGIQNRGVSPLVMPLHDNPAVYCIGLGDTTPLADIRVTAAQVNESVFLGSTYSLEAQLQCNSPSATPFKVTLYEGSKVLQAQNGLFDKGNSFKRISFTLQAKSPGLKQYRIEVSSLPGEINLANNRATAVTEVVDARKKIMLAAAASHPDVGAIKRLLDENARYQVSVSDPGLTPAPESADIFVLHGFPLNDNQAAWMLRLAASGKPFFHISSVQTQRAGLKALPGGISPSGNSQTEEVLPQVVPDFAEIAFEPEVLRRLASFPPLKVAYGRWQSDATQKVFLKQRIGSVETDYPLFYFRDFNNHRSVWLCGEGFWRWRLKEMAANGNAVASEALLFQTLQYLSVSESPKSFVLKSSKNEYEPGESVVLQATWLDAAGNRQNKSSCELTLEGEDGFKRVMPMARYNDVYRLETTGLPSGQFRARAKLDKSPAVFSSTVFYVSPVVAETAVAQANHALLRQWSSRYGGVFLPQNRVNELAILLDKNDAARPVVFTETKITELIHAKWFFLIIVLCFSLEWILRKYLGSY
ncbi:MAG: hypothetical protein ACK5FT_01800 [Sphingomonadales bacterium]|jgi:hypothetical protein